MRRGAVVFVAAIVACGRSEAPLPPPPPLSASTVLSRMSSAYANAGSYTDHGSFRDDDDLGARLFSTILRGPSHDTFTTSFTRGGALSFSYRYSYRHEQIVSGAELSALYGVTRGASAFVPRLLGAQPGHWCIRALSAPALR